jgi:C4-dicarboxylate-binding protein DctP
MDYRFKSRLMIGTAVAGALLAGGLSAAQAETFTLRVGTGHPAGPTVYVNMVQDFFVPEVKRRVAEETDHEIEFIEGYGGAIAGTADTLEAVETGLLDLGAYCFCFEPSKLFIHNFPYYAPFGPEDSVTALETARAVYDQVPYLTEVFETDYNQVLLGLSAWDNYHLGTTMEWETVEDLRGVKIAGAGPNLPWLEYAGAVPVQSALPDGYMSMQTGVYNGWIMFPSAYLGYRYHEPSPNYTLIGFGAMAVNGLTMNSASLARLPEEVQQIIREVGVEYEKRSGEELNARQAAGLKGLEEAGANIRELPQEARAGWAQSLAQYPSIQAKDADGRGLPGTEVMRAYLDAVAASGHTWLTEYELGD